MKRFHEDGYEFKVEHTEFDLLEGNTHADIRQAVGSIVRAYLGTVSVPMLGVVSGPLLGTTSVPELGVVSGS